ncbi:hypothetical protein VSR01_37285 [Actinacidiphila sp. DG2A-62]|uniref:hypothetical protein n=1 Tax=Actinacidiphila sp. DG2A-62 TaxID=3108821 RepID=UPI002DC049CD|nr:hypothetical protein [Actinacidiphila sp. DG2A-62]MEC3998837.1 hypothetical protein [Actinacidiphila sp. DG2A-62]
MPSAARDDSRSSTAAQKKTAGSGPFLRRCSRTRLSTSSVHRYGDTRESPPRCTAVAAGARRVARPASPARRQYSVSSEYRKYDSSHRPHAASVRSEIIISAPVAQSARVAAA